MHADKSLARARVTTEPPGTSSCSLIGGFWQIVLHSSRDNLQKRYLIHISGYNLGLIMRLQTGSGTPRRWVDAKIGVIWLRYPIDAQNGIVVGCLVIIDGQYQGAIIATELTLLTR